MNMLMTMEVQEPNSNSTAVPASLIAHLVALRSNHRLHGTLYLPGPLACRPAPGCTPLLQLLTYQTRLHIDQTVQLKQQNCSGQHLFNQAMTDNGTAYRKIGPIPQLSTPLQHHE